MIFGTPRVGSEEMRALDRIAVLQRRLRFYVAEPNRWVGSVRRVLAARAIQGSNSIEGHHVSVEDAIAAVVGDEPEEAAWIDKQAVLGYQRAMTYVIALAKDQHFSYSPALLRSLHFMMTEYSLDAGPGLWRPKPIWVRSDATGAVVYEAPDEADVPELMDELAASLTGDAAGPAMIRAAMAHLNLVMIHPFRDGNGRMARCLQTLVLAREQILAQEFCSIEEYLGRNTTSYYEILAEVGRGSWHPDNDATPWVRYCLTAHYVQAASVLRRITESEKIWAELDALRAKHRLQERSMAALFDCALGIRIKNSSYRAQLRGWQDEVSNQVATIDLKAMVSAGLIRAVGQKRGTYYVAADQVRELAARIRAERHPIDPSELFSPSPLDEPQLPFRP